MGLRGALRGYFDFDTRVSIYPKAEMGLRVLTFTNIRGEVFGFNLPEGRDGFKRENRGYLTSVDICFNLPEGRDGFKRENQTN